MEAQRPSHGPFGQSWRGHSTGASRGKCLRHPSPCPQMTPGLTRTRTRQEASMSSAPRGSSSRHRCYQASSLRSAAASKRTKGYSTASLPRPQPPTRGKPSLPVRRRQSCRRLCSCPAPFPPVSSWAVPDFSRQEEVGSPAARCMQSGGGPPIKLSPSQLRLLRREQRGKIVGKCDAPAAATLSGADPNTVAPLRLSWLRIASLSTASMVAI